MAGLIVFASGRKFIVLFEVPLQKLKSTLDCYGCSSRYVSKFWLASITDLSISNIQARDSSKNPHDFFNHLSNLRPASLTGFIRIYNFSHGTIVFDPI